MTAMLKGLKIADLSIVTAGAASTQVLADFGADVIKIESETRPDLYRMGFRGDQDSADDIAYPLFRVANRNKRGLSVNLKTDKGLEIAKRIIAQSDVVVENFRRGALERLGLGFAELVAIKQDIVLVSISSQGATGPDRGYGSFGTTLDSLGGVQSISGYDENTPTWSSGRVNYPDQTANSLAPGLILAAVLASHADGQPRWVDFSQRETVTTLLGDWVLKASIDHATPTPMGNSYPGEDAWVSSCADDDSWIAVSLKAEQERESLAAFLDVRLDPATDAAAQADRLRTATDRWAASVRRDVAAKLLRDAGVPAAPVRSGEELLDDRYFQERGWWKSVEKSDGGLEQQRGFAVDFGPHSPGEVRRRAPHVGEHTREVLEEAGYSNEQISAFFAEGIVSAPESVALSAT